VPKQFLVGYDAPLEPILVALTALGVLVGLAGLAALLTGDDTVSSRARNEIGLLLGLTAVALLLPVLAALAGEDHLITRNVIAALPLACVLVAAGLAAAARRAPRRTAAALAVACLAGAVTIAGVARSPDLQRDDWRAAVRSLGPIEAPRLIVATPLSALVPLRYYLPRLRRATPPQFTTAEIDQIALPSRAPGRRPQPPRPRRPVEPARGYTLASRTDGETFTVLRWRSSRPRPAPVAAAPGLDGEPAALLTVAAP
jgi:hypothetical protein